MPFAGGVMLVAILLSLGAINALIPLIIIFILILAAAGSMRGYSIFNLFGIATLAGFGAGAGKGTLARKNIGRIMTAPPFRLSTTGGKIGTLRKQQKSGQLRAALAPARSLANVTRKAARSFSFGRVQSLRGLPGSPPGNIQASSNVKAPARFAGPRLIRFKTAARALGGKITTPVRMARAGGGRVGRSIGRGVGRATAYRPTGRVARAVYGNTVVRLGQAARGAGRIVTGTYPAKTTGGKIAAQAAGFLAGLAIPGLFLASNTVKGAMQQRQRTSASLGESTQSRAQRTIIDPKTGQEVRVGGTVNREVIDPSTGRPVTVPLTVREVINPRTKELKGYDLVNEGSNKVQETWLAGAAMPPGGVKRMIPDPLTGKEVKDGDTLRRTLFEIDPATGKVKIDPATGRPKTYEADLKVREIIDPRTNLVKGFDLIDPRDPSGNTVFETLLAGAIVLAPGSRSYIGTGGGSGTTLTPEPGEYPYRSSIEVERDELNAQAGGRTAVRPETEGQIKKITEEGLRGSDRRGYTPNDKLPGSKILTRPAEVLEGSELKNAEERVAKLAARGFGTGDPEYDAAKGKLDAINARIGAALAEEKGKLDDTVRRAAGAGIPAVFTPADAAEQLRKYRDALEAGTPADIVSARLDNAKARANVMVEEEVRTQKLVESRISGDITPAQYEARVKKIEREANISNNITGPKGLEAELNREAGKLYSTRIGGVSVISGEMERADRARELAEKGELSDHELLERRAEHVTRVADQITDLEQNTAEKLRQIDASRRLLELRETAVSDAERTARAANDQKAIDQAALDRRDLNRDTKALDKVENAVEREFSREFDKLYDTAYGISSPLRYATSTLKMIGGGIAAPVIGTDMVKEGAQEFSEEWWRSGSTLVGFGGMLVGGIATGVGYLASPSLYAAGSDVYLSSKDYWTETMARRYEYTGTAPAPNMFNPTENFPAPPRTDTGPAVLSPVTGPTQLQPRTQQIALGGSNVITLSPDQYRDVTPSPAPPASQPSAAPERGKPRGRAPDIDNESLIREDEDESFARRKDEDTAERRSSGSEPDDGAKKKAKKGEGSEEGEAS